ncbi:phosphomannomutase/phosphoglucomutase [Seleniivibrio woodruffii]|uniref:phosphomannomutase/phosphoglucomutase n=1 Tax=Seleniivibrio woodruffii TaxID=1078050 RepID=UPI0026EA7F5A|nr:phosphomannomutase/phosphoglucomutase [Seleniivibrio woodruffii]
MLQIKEIFRSYDIRGVYGEKLTDSVAESAACVFAEHVRRETGKNHPLISLGRDVRFSSVALAEAVCRGLVKGGADVQLLGVCPSPLTYYSMYCTSADGYIMVTGSHNPPQFNGLKVGTKNTVYHSEKIMRIYEDIAAGRFPAPEKQGTVTEFDIKTAYIKYMQTTFNGLKEDVARFSKDIRVVIDCGSGTAATIAPQLFEYLGVEVLPLYCVEDGSFPGHHPDPTVEKNLAEAKALLLKKQADLCISYDGDADRLGALNNKGGMIWGDELLCIFADDIADEHRGGKVVGDVKAGQGLYEFIAARGMEPVMYKSGHSMIKMKMKEVGAVIGGEMSSHFFFADGYFGFDDGIYASLRLLRAYVNGLLSGKFNESADMTAAIPEYVNTPEIREPYPDDKKFDLIVKLSGVFARYMENGTHCVKKITDIDGIRIQFEKGWALVRASNTEPLLVTRYEAVNAAELEKIKLIITSELEKLK